MITITQQPEELLPAYGDNVISVVSDKVISNYKFKYVFDIFIYRSGIWNYVARVKVTPNPSGYGMLDISRYLQNYVEQNPRETSPGIEYSVLRPPTTNTGSTVNYLSNLPGGVLNYYVVVGEEYSTTLNGSVVLYNGNDTISSGTTLTSVTSDLAYGFNGTRQFYDKDEWTEQNVSLTYAAPTGRTLLTDSPRVLYKETDEYFSFSMLAGTYSGYTYSGGTFQMKVYDQNNTLLKTLPPSGATFNPIFTYLTQYMLIAGSNISDVVTPYENTWNKIVCRFGFTTPFSEEITIMRKYCPWDKYDPVDIVFLNRLGGWDTFRFYGSKNTNINIDRTTYKKLYGSWDQINWNYNTYERGRTNIKTDLIQEGEIMSDFLDIDTVNWLGELLTTPQAYIINTALDLKPISITDSSFKEQIRGNTKLRQVSFKYQYSQFIRTQNR